MAATQKAFTTELRDGELLLNAQLGKVNNPSGKGGTGRKSKDFTLDEVLGAIENSFGNMSVIAIRLDVSYTTAKRYVGLYPQALEAYEAEREKITDMGELVVMRAMMDNDPQVALFGARLALSRKHAQNKGWNGGGDGETSGLNPESKTQELQNAEGEIIVLTDEDLSKIKNILKANKQKGEKREDAENAEYTEV